MYSVLKPKSRNRQEEESGRRVGPCVLAMEALQAEIARKRKEREASQAASGEGGGARKWVKRGQIEQQRTVKYYETEAAEQEERSKKALAPQHRMAAELEAEAANSAASASNAGDAPAADRGGASSGSAPSGSVPATDKVLRPTEVMRRLRALGQPIRLFGEDDAEQHERYRAVSSAMPSEADVDLELQKGQTWGQSERQLFDESGNAKHQTAKEAATTDDADAKEDEAELAPSFVASTPEETISRFFKQLVKLWEGELEAREPAEVASQTGRTATSAFQQCKRHLKPFYKLLKAREMVRAASPLALLAYAPKAQKVNCVCLTRAQPLDLLGAMVEITSFMQQREYVKAHDAYIKCAIGNAPWPMGITGTGIHERQGRQHLREDKVAHVMNDETQRKYLQSVKRVMTFAQRAMPPTGPSKMVLNGSMI